jgi:hypothetical protein
MEQTTSRLRKTFQYPTDGDSDDDLPEALDEEGLCSLQSSNFLQASLIRPPLPEQESLIRTLHQENLTRNTQYAQQLLALPLASILLYLPSLFTTPTALLSLLSITSLLSTAYLLYSLPPGMTSIAFLDNLNNPSPSISQKSPQGIQGFKQFRLGDGPIAQYLPYLNLGLCTVLVLLGMVVGRRTEIWWGFEWLPAGVQAVVLLAKWVMGSVDPEGELGGLRYGFKGA